MDLEHLTKHQILLLTLLVSFVTSIATGIVTASLMDQAPQSVTRTINQIVEHTVETVTPVAGPQAAAVVTTEKTVVVKEDDLAAQSIGQVQKAMVRIAGIDSDYLLTRGVITDARGVAIADRGALAATGFKTFDAILPSGERVRATLRAGTSTIAVLDLAVGTSTGFLAAPLADASKLRLGQTVIRIGGTGADTVGTGVIARLPDNAHPDIIEASVSSATPGSVLMTLFGEVVGIVTSDTSRTDVYSVPTALLWAPDPPKKAST